MQARQPMVEVWISVILLAVTVSPVRSANQTQQGAPEDPDKIIAGLRQVTKRTRTDSVKQFQTHLDREIALHDRGYRSKDGRRIPGADADLFRRTSRSGDSHDTKTSHRQDDFIAPAGLSAGPPPIRTESRA